MCYTDTFLSSHRMWNNTHTTNQVRDAWLANWNHARSHLPHDCWSSYEYQTKLFVLIKWSYRSLCFDWLLSLEWWACVWACGSIFFEHKSFWCPILDPQLIIYHSDEVVQDRAFVFFFLLDQQMFTSLHTLWRHGFYINPSITYEGVMVKARPLPTC